jgi:hypothetical protein
MKFLLSTIAFSVGSVLMSCSSQIPDRVTAVPEWNFDHKLHFRKTKIDNRRYHLEIIRMDKTDFSQLSVFLLRKSFRLCGEYGYQIKVLSGIEGYLDKKTMPNYIQADLVAEIECGKKVK